MMPTQNCGIPCPISVYPRTARSAKPFGLVAAIPESGIPMSRESTRAKNTSDSVTGAASNTSSLTGTW